MMHLIALLKKRLLYFQRDRKGIICEVMVPILVVFIGLTVALINFIIESPSLLILPSIYPTPLNVVYSGTATPASMLSLTSSFTSSFFSFEYYSTTSKSSWDEYNYQLREINRKGSYFFNSIDQTNKQYSYDAEV